ncbi:MAG: amidase [Hyphomicrobiales bacterium]|jgi:aspartyl-tRNA(Asn)/glutamyl-tRNA(Gln) amidotransferase subunit A|nr:amidase [Hyphomicrobiales bacterium]
MTEAFDHQAGVAALLTAYRRKTVSPVDILTNAYRRLDAIATTLNPVSYEDRDAAFVAARASEARWVRGEPCGQLDGVVGSIKSNVMKKGWPMQRGSKLSAPVPMTFDSPVVASLVGAGMVVLCQTTMPEFGWKGVGDSPLTGVTRNPHDLSRTAGGSSAGAAVLAALGIGHLHLGTDGLGSVRIPSSFSGIFGLKPSFGRVPAYPASPFGILAHLGPMTRSVSDAAFMLNAMAQPDERDMLAWNTTPPDFRLALEDGVAGLRIGWSPRLGFVEGLDPEVESICAAAARRFELLGADVEAADPGFAYEDARSAADVMWQAGAAVLLGGLPEQRRHDQDPGFVAAGIAGQNHSAATLVAAFQIRAVIAEAMRRYHERYDLLVTPTMPVPAINAGCDTPADGSFGSDWVNWSPYTYPFNLTGQPAASLPVGKTASGLPVGLQIVGPARKDQLVMKAARALESAVGYAHLSD